MVAISYISKRSDFPLNYSDWSDDQKIRLFKEQIEGWQLNIAKYLLFGDNITKLHPHGAFGALAILISYFENIARYISGSTGDGKVNSYFVQGLREVYKKDISLNQYFKEERHARIFYDLVRNGLHHTGITKRGVGLNENQNKAIIIDNKLISIAPTQLYKSIEKHFSNYVTTLHHDHILKRNFLIRFDWLKSTL